MPRMGVLAKFQHISLVQYILNQLVYYIYNTIEMYHCNKK